jgi:hypothetical protein
VPEVPEVPEVPDAPEASHEDNEPFSLSQRSTSDFDRPYCAIRSRDLLLPVDDDAPCTQGVEQSRQ